MKVFFLYLMVVAVKLSLSECKARVNGGTVNLNNIEHEDYYEAYDDNTKYFYYLNVCGPISKICSRGTESYYPATEFYSGSCISYMGVVGSVSIESIEGGVSLTYGDGSTYGQYTRNTQINIYCDSKVSTPEQSQETFQFLEEDVDSKPNINIYKFSMRSKYACAVNTYPLGQYGIGGLVLTVFFVGVILFFVIGILVCRFGFKKKGTSMIPLFVVWKFIAVNFWSGILCIFESIKWVIVKCRGKLTKSDRFDDDPKVGYGSLDD